jgi:hypothetical protein
MQFTIKLSYIGNITHITATPALFSLITSDVESFPCLQSICLGGEAMRIEIAQKWGGYEDSRLRLYNVYGEIKVRVGEMRILLLLSLIQSRSN